MKIIIKRYAVRDRVFTVVKDQGMYLAIEDKYIDEHGRLNQSLNGFQMHAWDTLDGCLARVNDSVETQYLVSNGLSKAEAFCTVLGLPLTDEIRTMFQEPVKGVGA